MAGSGHRAVQPAVSQAPQTVSDDEAVVQLKGMTGFAGTVAGGLCGMRPGRWRSPGFGPGHGPIPSTHAELVACRDQGALPLDPRARGKDVKMYDSIDCPGHTEPVAVVPQPRGGPAAARGADAGRCAVPGAAAQHTRGTVARPPRAPVGRSA